MRILFLARSLNGEALNASLLLQRMVLPLVDTLSLSPFFIRAAASNKTCVMFLFCISRSQVGGISLASAYDSSTL